MKFETFFHSIQFRTLWHYPCVHRCMRGFRVATTLQHFVKVIFLHFYLKMAEAGPERGEGGSSPGQILKSLIF